MRSIRPRQPEVAAGEVRGDALADRPRLADVEDLAVLGVEEVDAGRVGQPVPLVGDALLAAELGEVDSASASASSWGPFGPSPKG